MGQELKDILDAVARGVFPPPDGRTTVVPQACHRDAGVLAFTAHAVVFTDEDPEWVRRTLAGVDSDALSAPMNPRFLAALMDRTDRTNETIDLLAVASPLPGEPPLTLTEIDDPGHHRVARAHRHRDDVRVWAADGGVLILGRGVAGRLEAAVEVAEGVRHRGLGRALASAARQLSGGEVVWAQMAPGNARSVRAFLGAGFVPVGGEALLLARG
ncbi:GNAT family N-acetyltransferase [Streptomyces geranii]|uniref:GNAT family N-acetyltransferase n=1 Tax=Streptomyces geranii TaxID=2058923 RepID=UPI000D03FA73|nr:GNAT family N-acetyltransferase [Streptomyces geranii]